MIDSVSYALPNAREASAVGRWPFAERGEPFAMVTLHRPSNVDEPESLRELMGALETVGREVPVVFPVHPRTRARLDALGSAGSQLRLMEPIGYLEMLGLVEQAALVITDSGGLQEETSFLGVPCLTVRPNTERPITISHGTNRLVAPNRAALETAAKEALAAGGRRQVQIERWDGKTAERIAAVLIDGQVFR